MWTARPSLVAIASRWDIGANPLRPGSPEAAATPPDALHEVMAGETLRLTAGDYDGDARQWERSWQANRNRVPNPNRIGRGTRLRILDAVLPDETYAECLCLARRIVIAVGGPARSEVGRSPEVAVQTSGETPPATASPRMESTIPPGPGAPTDPNTGPGASIRTAPKRP